MVSENKQNRRYKIIVILHNTLLATFIKLLVTVSKGLFRNCQLAPADFFMFPCPKNIMKGARFADVA
jgi:hypothetical protein